MNTKEKKKAIELLAEAYPDAKPALKFASPYQLLVAVVLSAQCTDERVNKVTAELFKEHGMPEKMAELSQEELEKYIYSCGFYHNKAAHILSATNDILTRYGGEVPGTLEELRTLAGAAPCGYSSKGRYARPCPDGSGRRHTAPCGRSGRTAPPGPRHRGLRPNPVRANADRG